MNYIRYLLKNPQNLTLSHLRRRVILNFAQYYSDRKFLEKLFPLRVGYKLNLDNPQTFNEKLQWLKLYDRRPEYSRMVDKVEAKKYVADIIGDEYIIPTLAVYNNAEDIDFDALPTQFVLKCTHDSGSIVICKDKAKLNRKASIKKLAHGLKVNYFYQNREWPYKNVKPRIIAEQYMTNNGSDLKDYKVHNFDGIPKIILLCCDRYKETGLTEDFFSSNWEHLDILRPDHCNAVNIADRPKEFDEMLRLSKQLSKNIPFVRSDFFIIGNKVFFNELTFFPASGMKPFVPVEWDYTFGSWITLPPKPNE